MPGDVISDPTSDTILSTQTVCKQTNSSATSLVVTNVSGGINSTYDYQWYEDTNPPTPVGTNSPTFTPPTNTVGTFEYYCVISNNFSLLLKSN